MRIAVIAESFLPHMNGVTGSVLQVVHHLRQSGHETLVVAPKAPGQPEDVAGVEVPETTYLASLPLPSYPDVRVALAPVAQLKRILTAFAPDVVHLASPAVLGWQGVVAADSLGIPTVAIYQTDVIAYAERYGVPGAAPLAQAHIARLHRRATLTLAPSSHAEAQLAGLGVDRLHRWGRGVDAERFRPERRSAAFRERVLGRADPGTRVIGYVGRLAPEKQVDDLRALADVQGAKLVIVGDGPERERLERELPGAHFTGFLGGIELAEAVASFDIFVHPGESETFCQTVQEALASGVPVVAVGRGGPVDLVRSSVDGWLYRPGDLADLRARVADLAGDETKRASFAAAARGSVAARTWAALTDQLVVRYAEAARLRRMDTAAMARGSRRAAEPVRSEGGGWGRYVALGDSLTEGLCDDSRVPDGEYRGWADRLAMLLAQHAPGEAFRFANLAVRSRRVRDLERDQVPAALELRPQLVSILMGHNDLIGHAADPHVLAAAVERSVARLREAGVDVLLVTPFLPRRFAARMFARRFAVYASELRRIADAHGAVLLDSDALPDLGDTGHWSSDKVHLRSSGHRMLAYRAAEVLGVRDAPRLAELDRAFHEDADETTARWVTHHALPWVWRRLRGRTAGDGLLAKHSDYVEVRAGGTTRDGADAR